VPFEPAKYRYLKKNIVIIAQLQRPAVTKVEIQSANLVQFLKVHGLTFCVKYFFLKKTVITLNQKLTYQHFSNSNYQKTVREMMSRTRKPRSRVGGGTSPSHTKKRRLKVISFGKRRFKHPRLS